MYRFCTRCGAELINGACPNCSGAQPVVQYQQPTAQYQQLDAQYQQQNYQYQQQPVVEVDPNDERFKTFFMNPKEKFVCALGNGYLMNFLAGGFLGNGFAVVSDKRVYFKGRAFEFGENKFNVKTVTSTVDLKDVTGTETRTIKKPGNMAAGILLSVFGLLMLILYGVMKGSGGSMGGAGDAIILSLGLFMMIMGLIMIMVYFVGRNTLLTIMFGGGGIAFPLNWYPAQEGENFQRMLRIAKDQVVEEAEKATANAMREVFANTVAPQPQAAVSAADELTKYAQLYKDGLISEQEFADLKAKFLSRQ